MKMGNYVMYIQKSTQNKRLRLNTILIEAMEARGLACDWNEKLEYVLSSSLKSKPEKLPVVGDGTICKNQHHNY